MSKRKLNMKDVRKEIEEGSFLEGFLRLPCDLEFHLFTKLFFERGIKTKLMNNWTLREYIEWCLEFGLINKEQGFLLKDFNELRNVMVHNRDFMIGIKEDYEKGGNLITLALAVCDFLDKNWVEYKYNKEIEGEYGESIKKLREKYENVFKKMV